MTPPCPTRRSSDLTNTARPRKRKHHKFCDRPLTQGADSFHGIFPSSMAHPKPSIQRLRLGNSQSHSAVLLHSPLFRVSRIGDAATHSSTVPPQSGGLKTPC